MQRYAEGEDFHQSNEFLMRKKKENKPLDVLYRLGPCVLFFLFFLIIIIPQQRETSEAYQLVTNSRSVVLVLVLLLFLRLLILGWPRLEKYLADLLIAVRRRRTQNAQKCSIGKLTFNSP